MYVYVYTHIYICTYIHTCIHAYMCIIISQMDEPFQTHITINAACSQTNASHCIILQQTKTPA